jgi:hypothetical protein
MNHLKAAIIRKKYIEIAAEEKKGEVKKFGQKKLRPSSSIKSINEVPSAFDLRYENPPQFIYTKPAMKQGLPLKRQLLNKGTTNRAILREIEKETQEAEQEYFKAAHEEIKVHRRPVTAVNTFKPKHRSIGRFQRQLFNENEEEEIVREVPKEVKMPEEEELVDKEKFSIEEFELMRLVSIDN